MDIYTISNWQAGTVYTKNAIVINNNYYYYSKEDHTSSSSFTTDSNKWDGIITYNGQTKPFFFWKLSYNYSLDVTPTVKIIKFGDGYEQSLADGINNILLKFDISFDNRDLAEYRAILHFLHSRNGNERFYFIPPAPYNVVKLFTCPQWIPSQPFYNNYSIKCRFEEKVA